MTKERNVVAYYDLNKGDRAMHGDDLHTFIKVDGMYAKWTNADGEMVTWHCYEYIFDDKNNYYIPVTEETWIKNKLWN